MVTIPVVNGNLSKQIVVIEENFNFSVDANNSANISFKATDVPGYTVAGIVGLMFWGSQVLLVGNYISGENTINIRLFNSYTNKISSSGVIRLLYIKN